MKLFFFLLLFFGVHHSEAQPIAGSYIEFGRHNASDGYLMRSAFISGYDHKNYSARGGFQADIISNRENIPSAYYLRISREVLFFGVDLDLGLLYQRTPYENLFSENNFGILLEYNLKKLELGLGTSIKSYLYTRDALKRYNIAHKDRSLNEYWNTLYFVRYNLKPPENTWNLGLMLTNFDYFMINQETNPVFSLQSYLKIKESLSLFAEAWYKSAGAFNLSVNYFGFLLRTGLIWELDF